MSGVIGVDERLAALTAAGTSVWLDEIQRGLIARGELQQLVEHCSLRGVTSNPAIFEKAILGSSDYDAQIAELAERGSTALEILHAIAIRDVGAAADVLAGVHTATGGADGFVSLEVDPDLAHDPERTLAQAREFWAALDRPNVMIKIPGTEACVPAIEQATYEGINVNVTLLFSVEGYERVADAYVRGLARRHAEGRPLDVHSVASFFVSRVDTEVDQRLAALGREDLRGRAGLANARAAYRRFKAIFGGARFAALRAAGAPVQRPLWASTGVKDPAYPETLYVDGLVGPDTVNTMPMQTLRAAAEASVVAGATAEADPDEDLRALAAAGIDLDDVTDALLRAGIAKFVEPAEKLLASIEAKRAAAQRAHGGVVVARQPDAEACARYAAEQIAAAVEGGARNIALAGGSTPRRCYELLGALRDDWTGVTFWYGDERCVGPHDPDSNHRMVLESLQAPGARLERIRGELGPDEAADRYARALDGVTLDVALLGLGEDGHTASLFPGSPALDAKGAAVAVRDAPKPPPERVSLTFETLDRARRTILLVAGAGKAEPLARVLRGSDPATPASLLNRDRLLVVADEAAVSGSDLTTTERRGA